MKLLLLLFALIPLVYCASLEEKRFLLTDVKQVVDEIVAALGSDYTEKGCESLCLGSLHLLGSSTCPSICRAVQTAMVTLHGD